METAVLDMMLILTWGKIQSGKVYVACVKSELYLNIMNHSGLALETLKMISIKDTPIIKQCLSILLCIC